MNARLSLVVNLIWPLTAIVTALAAMPDVEFTESEHGAGTQLLCKRNGLLIYKDIEMPVPKMHTSFYTFYWDGKPAVTVLTIDGKASIQQFAGLPVSFVIGLDASGLPSLVAVERPDGTVIDAILRKGGTRLTPVPTSEVRPLVTQPGG